MLPLVSIVYGKGYVEDKKEPNDIHMRKVMSLLEKVEVSYKLVRGMSTDVVTRKNGVNKYKILFITKNEHKIKGNIKASAPASGKISCVSC